MFDSNYNNASNCNNFPSFEDQYGHDNHLLNINSQLLLNDDDIFLNTILPYHTPPPPPPPPPLTTTVTSSGEKRDKKKQQDGEGGPKSSRRTGKKDRHSKIYTAQGPRDRRMRLSLQIARRFFDLQDMLGFDKASKTIEWLFHKSKSAIKDLTDKTCTSSLMIPSPPLEFPENNGEDIEHSERKKSKKEGLMLEINEKRKEARARARERTKEKLMMQTQGKGKGKASLMKNKQVLGIIMEENPNEDDVLLQQLQLVPPPPPLEDQMASVGIIEKFFADAASSSSSSSSSFSHECGDAGLISRGFSMEFPANGITESGLINSGFMEGSLVMNSDYSHHFQSGPNSGFMGRDYNQGF